MTPPPNFVNRTIWTGDNLDILRGLNSETVDLIYLDPPFNSNRDYAAPVGSQAAGAAFKDTWTLSDLDVAWAGYIADEHPAVAYLLSGAGMAHGKGMQSYLTMMAVRLLELRRVLKPTGSIWLHCDSIAAHYLKLLLDAVFGQSRYRNEVVWRRHGGRPKGSQHAPRTLGRDTDTLLHYTVSDEFTWHGAYRPLTADEVETKFPHTDERGRYNTKTEIFCQPSMGARPNLCYTYPSPHGPVTNPHPSGWRISRERLAEMDARGEIIWREGKRPLRKAYAENYKGKPVGTLWADIENATGSEAVGYPTQKPLALLERIIKASSSPGDVLLDPFCGCATACVAAEKLGRQWLGVDLSPKAVELVNERLRSEMGDLFHYGFVTSRTDVPLRSDLDVPVDYRTHKHVLYGEQEGRCAGCRVHFEFRNLTVDHEWPKSKGGTDHISNLQLLCGHCNSVKGNRPMEYLLAQLAETAVLVG